MSQGKTGSGGGKRAIIAGMLGNGLEWYDFAIYAILAPTISHLFFPAGNADVNLIKTYGIFAAGFIFRPIGAVLFGYLGEKFGRRFSLYLALFMMAVPTGLIGLLPTYQTLGFWAPVLLTLMRILQGLSLGGAFSGSIAFMVEHSPQHKRGVAGSASIISLSIGFLAGSLVSGALVTLMPVEIFESWGWRLPFLAGVLIGLVGFYIKEHCEESPVYEAAKERGEIAQNPIKELFTVHWRGMLTAIGAYMLVTIPFYMISTYFISYSEEYLGQTKQAALWMNAGCLALFLVLAPVSGWASDRFGRKQTLLTIAVVTLLLIYPIFSLFGAPAGAFPALSSVVAAQLMFAFWIGLYLGPVPTLLVEIFPTRVRYSGMALSYNICAATFGGTAPMICKYLIVHTGDPLSIVYYALFAATAAVVALALYKDRSKEPLI